MAKIEDNHEQGAATALKEEVPLETQQAVTGEEHAAPEAAHAEEEGGGHHVVLAPEILGHAGPLPITNTLIVSWVVMGVLILAAFFVRLNLKKIPVSKVQNGAEALIEAVYNMVADLAHSKARTFFPWLMTFFLFILIANLFGLFPGFATITYNHLPLLRSINSDLNMTLALGLTSVVVTHFYAIKFLGIGSYFKKWFSLEMFGIFLFVGLLELVGEFTKIVSLSLRLFGNIFAGEVVLGTVSGIFAFFVPLPFYFLEVIVAVVQAGVFMMLTLAFMVLLTEKHETH
jgi:F-type H+-transporting ATPase subunit a